LFDGENISYDASLVIYIYIHIYKVNISFDASLVIYLYIYILYLSFRASQVYNI